MTNEDGAVTMHFDPAGCAACRVLDHADGEADGGLFHFSTEHVRAEHWIWRRLRKAEDVTAERITQFAGSMRFVYIHAAWFGVWIAVNVGLITIGHEFDKFPFGLLTMIVSLEAIFLATFVMITQNRLSARESIRAQLDFETNIRAEIWSLHIGAALGIDSHHVEAVVSEAITAAQRKLDTPV